MQNKRKVLLINRPFQITFMVYMFVFSICVSAVVYISNMYFFSKFEEQAMSMGLPPNHMLLKFLESQKAEMGALFLGTSFALLSVLIFGGLILSHRVAGPLYKLSMFMDKAVEEGKLEPVSFRKKDFFQEIAEKYNKIVDKFSK